MTLQSQRSDLSDGAQYLAQCFACGEDGQLGTRTLLEESQFRDPKTFVRNRNTHQRDVEKVLSSAPGQEV